MRGHTSTRSKPRARRVYPRETISRRAIEGDGLLALRRLLESPRLISRAVEYVRDFCPAARPAVVDEVFAGWKTLHPCGDLIRRPAGIRVFAHYPEPVDDAVDEPVRVVRTCPLSPAEKDLVEVEFRVPSRHDTASLGGDFVCETLAPSRLHAIRQLLQTFAPLIFPAFAGLDRIDARPDTPADVFELLRGQIEKHILGSGPGEPYRFNVLILHPPQGFPDHLARIVVAPSLHLLANIARETPDVNLRHRASSASRIASSLTGAYSARSIRSEEH